LSTTLVKFEDIHGTFNKERKKKHPLLPTTLINWFERSCGTFQKEEKTHCHQQH
jgi:hypothetical protein